MTNEQPLPTPGERPTAGRPLAWIILSTVLGLVLIGYTFALYRSLTQLATCRENRDSLGQLVTQKQAVADSIKWSGRLAHQQIKTDSLSHENSRLRERITLDSCARLSDLALMRSVNQRYRRH